MQITQVNPVSPKPTLTPVSDLDVTKLINLRDSKTFLKKRLEQIDLDLSTTEDE